MLVPDELQDYVVVHELCHRIHMNHSPEFWAEVGKVLPDYKQRRKRLKENRI
jgi:predicted metal-dependent hydrolase